MRFAGLFIVGFSALSVFAQAPGKSAAWTAYHDVPQHVLTAGNRIQLNIPMPNMVGNTRCDASGDLFFGDLSFSVRSPFFGRGPYIEISADGQSHQIFSLPKRFISHGYNIWAVTPDGTLYVLHDDDLGDGRLVEFKSDGSVADISSLALPQHVTISKMAVADSGAVFVSGYRVEHQSYKLPESGFAGIFIHGNMLRNLSAGTPKVSPGMLGGDLIAGDDGRFYVLDGNAVHVFSQSGEEFGDIKIVNPVPKAMAVRIDEWQGILSVAFYVPSKTKTGSEYLVPRTVLLDAQTGDILGAYTFDSALTGVLCYSSEGYTMSAVDDGKVILEEVPLR